MTMGRKGKERKIIEYASASVDEHARMNRHKGWGMDGGWG